MAEAITKKFYGADTYVQSVGVQNDMEIDGFSVAVCQEIGVELDRHQSRSFDDMQEQGEDLGSYDLVVALSAASKSRAEDLSRFFHIDLEYWPITDPSGAGETRDAKLDAYRTTRDEIIQSLTQRWGVPETA
jgi:protein-tyrosine-phosphatase